MVTPAGISNGHFKSSKSNSAPGVSWITLFAPAASSAAAKLALSETVTNPRVGFPTAPAGGTKSHNSSSPSHRSPSETGVPSLVIAFDKRTTSPGSRPG